jgi:hypothetical protein
MKRERALYAQVTQRAWWRRAIRISGDVEALVEYDSRAFFVDGASAPRIRVNGAEIVAAIRGHLRSRHRLLLPAIRRGLLPVLEVEFTHFGLQEFRFFRLSLGSDVLYEEQWGLALRLATPPPLPIPSSVGSSAPAALPIPSEPVSDVN